MRSASYDVVFVSAHGYTADSLEEQKAIYSRMSYPLLQERKDASLRDVWGATDRNDVFMFSRNGTLLTHIPAVNNVSTPGGYATFKDQLLAQLKQLPKP